MTSPGPVQALVEAAQAFSIADAEDRYAWEKYRKQATRKELDEKWCALNTALAAAQDTEEGG